jgi:circadian clock protein KaiB
VIQISLKLYITGTSAISQKAIDGLDQLCETLGRDRCQAAIINLLEQPELARKDKILVTPTLIRILPKPPIRIIGDLSDVQKIIAMLELKHEK